MNKEIELKPCPFCGGVPKLEPRVDYSWGYRSGYSKITCDCGIHKTVNIRGEDQSDIDKATALVIKDWNSRPIEAQLQAENERLRGIITELQINHDMSHAPFCDLGHWQDEFNNTIKKAALQHNEAL